MGRLYPVGAQYAALGLGAIDSLERQGATAQPNESGAAVLAPLWSNNIFAYAYGTVPMGISNTAGVGNSATIFFAFELVLP
ncbi:hypothetical protein ZQ72_26880 [Salmonella enterica subsp. enterica]|nr:hypothetical protein [Salmonella enterica subsp. enterica]